jgi:hypothetical protein
MAIFYRKIEKNTYPEFDLIINSISVNNKVPYYDFSILNQDLSFTDGNHLSKESAIEVSMLISRWINIEMGCY